MLYRDSPCFTRGSAQERGTLRLQVGPAVTAQIVGFRDSSLSSRLLHFEPHVPDVPVPLSTELPDGPP